MAEFAPTSAGLEERGRTEEARPEEPPESVEGGQPATPATLQGAIDQVHQIVNTLRQALEEMEEVLELLEALERQAGADQRELESLRRALRQLQRPREGGETRHR